MEKSISAIIHHESLFTIKWRLTEWCNYRCSYCLRKFKGQDTKLDFERVLRTAPEINRLIEESGRPTKINLIGGEVTYFDLKRLISCISSKNLKKVNITTNFSNSLESYIDFAKYLESREILLSMTASLHDEYVDAEEFVSKFKKFKDACNPEYVYQLKIEFVIAPESKHLLQKVIDTCKKYDVELLLEFDKSQNEDFAKEFDIQSSVSKPRWKIIYSDNSEDTTLTRSKLINRYPEKAIPSADFYCTAGITYIYVNKDKVAKNSYCVRSYEYTPISEYHIKDLKPIRCISVNGLCSLCGDFSIAKDRKVLDDLLEKKTSSSD